MRHQARGNRQEIRFFCVALAAFLFAVSVVFAAEQPAKRPRVGYISGRDSSLPGPLVEAFRQRTSHARLYRRQKYNCRVSLFRRQERSFQNLIRELVDLKVDVLVIPIQITNAKRLVTTIPIVTISSINPVTNGLIASLARPGGNITGLTTLSRELGGKRLELLKELTPRLVRIVVLHNTDDLNSISTLKELETAAAGAEIGAAAYGRARFDPRFRCGL